MFSFRKYSGTSEEHMFDSPLCICGQGLLEFFREVCVDANDTFYRETSSLTSLPKCGITSEKKIIAHIHDFTDMIQFYSPKGKPLLSDITKLLLSVLWLMKSFMRLFSGISSKTSRRWNGHHCQVTIWNQN